MACIIILILYTNLLSSYFVKWYFFEKYFDFHASPELEWQTPNPIWKEICPCKSSGWTLALPNSSVVDFYHVPRDFNWNPELLLWRAGFVFSQVSFCRYLLFRRWVCDFFCKIMWFWYPSRFHRPLFSEYLGVHFPNFGYISNSVLKFRIRIDGLCFRSGVFWNLFRDLLAFCIFFGGVFSQQCPKCLGTVSNRMLTVLSKLIGFICPLYLE